MAELKSSLAAFATFARSLNGDEKSEAQSFLDHFFRALGHPSAIAAGATFEFRIAKKPGSSQLELLKGESAVKAKGGKKYGDLVWPERVLIEMKSRGENLEKHYDQLFDYWTHIVPRKPAYAILCNFDEFWIYDFNIQLFDPVDRVLLRDLADSSSAFNFLLPIPARPIFEFNRVDVTRKAVDNFATVFRKIIARGEDRTRTQRGRRRRGAARLAPRDHGQARLLPTRPLPHLDEHGANPLRDAHARLDTAVRTAYAMPKAADPLAFLLALNLTLGVEEKSGRPIIPPGLPLPKVQEFISEDCLDYRLA